MFKLVKFFIVGILVAGVSATARAQEEEKVTVSANLVSVNVSVTDSRGRHVEGLGAERFEVFDDGVRQRVAHFSAGDAPFSVGVVYDMHPTTRERSAAVLDALKRFAASLRRDDDLFLLVFNERASATVDFIPTAEQMGEHLAYVPPRGPNSLYDAVYLAGEKLRSRPSAKRALLVISDGIDHNSRHSYAELRRRVGEFNVQLYGIVTGETDEGVQAGEGRWAYEDLTRGTGRRILSENSDAALGQAALGEVARASGGASYVPQTESGRELFDICSQAALEMRRQYTVGFYPTDASGAARWHRIRVRVSPTAGAGRLRLTYREGYRPRMN